MIFFQKLDKLGVNLFFNLFFMSDCSCGDNCPLCEGCGQPECDCICDFENDDEEDDDY